MLAGVTWVVVDFVTNPRDGTPIAYRSTGPAVSAGTNTGQPPPVVLVHGTALSQAIWRGFGYVRDLAVDHTVITLDLRGHGRSGKPHESSAYGAEAFVGDVLAVLDALGIERAHYVGYSLGGRVGFSLATTRPERMLSFVSAGGSPRTSPGTFDRVFFAGCIAVLEADGMEGFLDAWEASVDGRLSTTTRAAFVANDPLALAAYMRESERDAGVPDAALVGIRVSTLLLAGTRDGERMRAAEHALALLSAATLHALDGATHSDTLRHPDALPAIRAFLAANPSID